MNSSIAFVVAALAMSAAASGILAWAFLRARPVTTQASQAQANAAVYRDQLTDLDNERALGALDDAALASAKDELKRRLLEDTASTPAATHTPVNRPVALAVAAALLLPMLGMAGYMALGNPDALNPQAVMASAKTGETPDMVQLVEKLASKLEANPNNVEGWMMLGRSYRSLQRLDEALKAYDKAVALDPDDEIALERAELLAERNGAKFDGEPWRVIKAILAKDPQHYSALLLAGSASFTERKFADAIQYWQKARGQLAPGEKDAEGLDNALAKARTELGLPPQAAPSAAMAKDGKSTKAASNGGQVSGKLTLAPALRAKASPDDTVFVYAIPTQGERAPLAIIRTTVGKLPLDFTLDDSTAMNPQRKLSGETQVTLKARVSKSGNAMAQTGDLLGSLTPVKVGSKDLSIVINEELK